MKWSPFLFECYLWTEVHWYLWYSHLSLFNDPNNDNFISFLDVLLCYAVTFPISIQGLSAKKRCFQTSFVLNDFLTEYNYTYIWYRLLCNMSSVDNEMFPRLCELINKYFSSRLNPQFYQRKNTLSEFKREQPAHSPWLWLAAVQASLARHGRRKRGCSCDSTRWCGWPIWNRTGLCWTCPPPWPL